MSVKILQFVPEALPSFRADVSVLFGKYLPRHQVYCDVVGMASPAELTEQGFSSARRPRYQPSRIRRELAYVWLSLRALLAVRRTGCQAIQVRDMVPIGLMALIAARLQGLPFYYWVSYLMSEGRIERAQENLRRHGGLRNRLVLWKGQFEQLLLYRLVLPAADHVFVQSDAMLALMRSKGLAEQKLTAVPMGVDMELLDGLKGGSRRPPGWEDVPLIAYLGTLDKARNLERVVDAMLIVRQTYPDARLLLIGNSPIAADEKELLAYAAAAGAGDMLRITGWLPSAQAWELLRGAQGAISYIPRGQLYDVSSPTKMLEYLALGMPAVGNDTPDQALVLEASAAGWLTRSTPAAMAEALVELLGDPQAARARASRGAPYIAAHRSYDVLADLVARRYHSLLRH